jgi:hypothetical protein
MEYIRHLVAWGIVGKETINIVQSKMDLPSCGIGLYEVIDINLPRPPRAAVGGPPPSGRRITSSDAHSSNA